MAAHEYVLTWELPEGYPAEYMDMLTYDVYPTIARFVEKSQDYPPEGFKFLGVRGQFSDLARKFFKIKRVVWDGEDKLQGEQIDEVIDDMIGHLIIMRHMVMEGR